MKDLSPDDRPREKLLTHGAAALGDNELLALVLGSGSRDRNALAVANELLAAHGGLPGLLRSSVDDLSRATGVGHAKAAQVLAAIELGRRALLRRYRERPQLLAPSETAAFLMPVFGGRAIEQFGVVLLDTKYRVIRTALVATGTLNSTIVEPRDVYREAAMGGAFAVVAFHNHPSGDPVPSPHDVELTNRLRAAGTLMGIDLIDHVILGDGRYFSFKETGYW
ncbi:MAG TPA: DNA repair protein RadC [Vicinamibacterales bacterium]|nr:DNA repair protein RadC [Vicinamibacterales bacterium]